MSGALATMEELVARLKRAKRVAIFTHQRPDPDALGSQTAAAWILKALGATEIQTVHFAKPPAPYAFLADSAPGEQWEFDSEWAGSASGAVDTILVVDTCTYSQMEPATTVLKGERGKVVAIDHHLSRDDVGPVIYADTKAAACVEILWEVAKRSGVEMHEPLALALMAGLVSDTGWFRFDSVTPRTHEMAADLTPHVNNAQLYERLMQTETKPKMLLMQHALDSLKWAFDDRFACMSLKQSDFAETGAVASQTEYLVDMPLTVQTVEVVALLTEMPDGRVRGSLRSKRDVDVNQVCRKFGGGGHAKAAGLRTDGPLEEAVARVTAAVGEALGK
ncbi:MAG TPA: bifunctional oligoribonuclease/PAP phosphatase NrnA [Phycisphaerae bacterium]|nr:bifunctional oligoribonuclease/PAP phosphatase NrnA [Phycisphaerae bacterium]